MLRPKQMVKRAEVEVAKAKRTCKFTSQAITKGAICLVIYDGPRDRSCYSKAVALEMVKLARERLDELESQLTQSQPS